MLFSEEFNKFREKLLDNLFAYIPFLAILAVSASVYRYVEFGWQDVYLYDLIAGFILILIFFIRKKLSFKFKVKLLLTILYFAAVTELNS